MRPSVFYKLYSIKKLYPSKFSFWSIASPILLLTAFRNRTPRSDRQFVKPCTVSGSLWVNWTLNLIWFWTYLPLCSFQLLHSEKPSKCLYCIHCGGDLIPIVDKQLLLIWLDNTTELEGPVVWPCTTRVPMFLCLLRLSVALQDLGLYTYTSSPTWETFTGYPRNWTSLSACYSCSVPLSHSSSANELRPFMWYIYPVNHDVPDSNCLCYKLARWP